MVFTRSMVQGLAMFAVVASLGTAAHGQSSWQPLGKLSGSNLCPSGNKCTAPQTAEGDFMGGGAWSAQYCYKPSAPTIQADVFLTSGGSTIYIQSMKTTNCSLLPPAVQSCLSC